MARRGGAALPPPPPFQRAQQSRRPTRSRSDVRGAAAPNTRVEQAAALSWAPSLLASRTPADGDGPPGDPPALAAAALDPPALRFFLRRGRREHRTAYLLHNRWIPLCFGGHGVPGLQCYCHHYCHGHHLWKRLLVLPEIHLLWMLCVHPGGTPQETGPKQIRRTSVTLWLLGCGYLSVEELLYPVEQERNDQPVAEMMTFRRRLKTGDELVWEEVMGSFVLT